MLSLAPYWLGTGGPPQAIDSAPCIAVCMRTCCSGSPLGAGCWGGGVHMACTLSACVPCRKQLPPAGRVSEANSHNQAPPPNPLLWCHRFGATGLPPLHCCHKFLCWPQAAVAGLCTCLYHCDASGSCLPMYITAARNLAASARQHTTSTPRQQVITHIVLQTVTRRSRHLHVRR